MVDINTLISNEEIETWKRHTYCEVEAEFEPRSESL